MTRTVTRAQGGPLLGFGPFVRKEAHEWRRSKRLWILLVLMLLFSLFALLGPIGLRALVQTVPAASEMSAPAGTALAMLPDAFVSPAALSNTLAVIASGSGMALFLLVLTTANILVVERQSGTLAWNLTKPLARRSLVLAKWGVATLLFWLASSIVPLLLTFIPGVLLYGGLPTDPLLVLGTSLVLLLSSAFGVLLVLFLSLFLNNQGAIIGIALGLYFAPLALGNALPEAMRPWLERLWPTHVDRPFSALLAGQPLDPIALVAAVAWFIGLTALTFTIFQRQEVN
ncbi:MAG: ABC transporter permease [Chloroflexaceae bacterium]|nr:ABC transporter permease [Chloroflexaceae bacterium]